MMRLWLSVLVSSEIMESWVEVSRSVASELKRVLTGTYWRRARGLIASGQCLLRGGGAEG